MTRRVISAVLALGVSCGLLLSAATASKDPAFSQIDSIVKVLSELSGLSEAHPVPYGRMSKRQLRKFLDKRIKRSLKPEEISADELALKMFGFVPETFDLRRSTVDLLAEQAAAFYDYDAKKLFLLEDASLELEQVTLAHELSHALADQHFNLARFMDDMPANDDENLAHSSVVEGQATWLMLAYTLQQSGRPPLPTAAMLASVADSNRSSMEEYPVLKDAPLYIQQSLLFPYAKGTEFFDAVYKQMGMAAFTAVFTRPPVDSAQIIHPERYFRHEPATHPDLLPIELSKESATITEGSFGEFDHQILLQQYAPQSSLTQLASHVRGGAFKISRDGGSHTPVLQYSSDWDSEETAASFFATYPKILAGKWKRCDVTSNRPGLLAGTGDNGHFVCRLRGRRVQAIEGIADATQWQKLTISELVAARLH